MPPNTNSELGRHPEKVIHQEQIDQLLSDLRSNRVVERIWQKDESLWPQSALQPTPALGWLNVMDELLAAADAIKQLVEDVCTENYSHVVLLGMGGASIASEVLRTVFGVKQSHLSLIVLNSNDPLSVMRYSEQLDPRRTLFLLCSKSGYTVETTLLFRYFYHWVAASEGNAQAGEHFVAITDPESETAALARALGFRMTFLSNPAISGHYSALSHFGMVPAALAGIDFVKLLQRASDAAANCRQLGAEDRSAWLAALLVAFSQIGRDKITFITSASLTHVGLWLEQLLAGSLGKAGVAIFPVEGEALLKPRYYRTDRLFFYLRMVGDSALDAATEQLRSAGQPVIQLDITHLSDLGAEFFHWQMACTIASHLLEINPFVHPAVDATKAAVEQALKKGKSAAPDGQSVLDLDGVNVNGNEVNVNKVAEGLRSFLAATFAAAPVSESSPFTAILSFLSPSEAVTEALEELRTQLQRRLRLATSSGYSPRFLHSSSELHLDGAGQGRFIQLTANPTTDVEIPAISTADSQPFSLSQLISAQVDVNWQMLRQRNRAVIRIHLGDTIEEGLQQLIEILRDWEI